MTGTQKLKIENPVVILANGKFPEHPIPLDYLNNSGTLICCDGAVDKLDRYGNSPDFIIGDFDSISTESKLKYGKIIIQDSDQNQNDLHKSLSWCVSQNVTDVIIIGATGQREDHTIGNIFRLFDFSDSLSIEMITDFGKFTLINRTTELSSYIGQQVSIFLTDSSIKLTSENLKFSLQNECLPCFYFGTLNESLADNFQIQISHGSILVYREHSKK